MGIKPERKLKVEAADLLPYEKERQRMILGF